MAGAAASFPRQAARSRNFTLGQPRGFTVAPGGERVAFLRSLAGDDPVNRLWVLDLDPDGPGGRERLVADPAALLAAGPGERAGAEELSTEERARRERARERAGGIVAYAADRELRTAAFGLSGRLFVADLTGAGVVREVLVGGPVLDPRPDPAGRRVAYVRDGALYVTELDPDGGDDAGAGEERRVTGDEDHDERGEVTWGLAEFIAAEEMGRDRGFWWSPDGRRLAVARVDTAPVPRFWLADPAHPGIAPAPLPYPAAGTGNAEVRLFVVGVDPGSARVEVGWDRAALPYLVAVIWEAAGPLTLLVQSRDQRRTLVLAADPESGDTRQLAEATDPAWVEIVPGVPAWLAGGRLLGSTDDAGCDTRRLTVDGAPVTPPGLQVQEVLASGGEEVLLAASDAEAPTEVHLWRLRLPEQLDRVTTEPGVHTGTAAGGVTVVAAAAPDHDGTRTTVRHDGDTGGQAVAVLLAHTEAPLLRPRVRPERLGARELRAALLLPSWHTEADGPLPVLLDPYGGPHARRVLASRNAFLTSQWFAEQGFAVLVCDAPNATWAIPAPTRASISAAHCLPTPLAWSAPCC